MARRELTPKMRAARQWVQHRTASFATIPSNPAIGSLVTLNAQGLFSCTNPITVTARVAAVSNLAIVVADTGNPIGGFTDAEYLSIATTFDTLISPLDIANFGAPADVDKNGKTIIFFTKEVNKLTPRGSGGFIGGFFFERDLLPKDSTATLPGCATSNVGEIYYSLVPDPTGRFSDIRNKADVLDDTPGTLAHEFQHLINADRRIYINNAKDFEDTWLNEGLSHIAEELLYYHVAKLSPRQNINTATIRANQPASVVAFEKYQGQNTGRYEVFLGKPNETSVYSDNDSLETRGATWSLLRYLADRHGATDATFWFQLVNSDTSGQTNLRQVIGADYLTQIRDWATSVFADDITGQTNPLYSQPSWNYRDIFPSLVDANNNSLRFPLKVFPLSDAGPVNVSVFAGGAAYLRFFVPAGGSGSIDWSSGGLPVSPLVQFTVVRSR
jgi:hypothetical protein